MTAASRASSSASIPAAVPRYRSDTSFGLPSARPISRRYQYYFPLITFLYRLAILLGHRPIRPPSQASTRGNPRSRLIRCTARRFMIKLARKLGLAASLALARPDSPVRAPALAHIDATDTEQAERVYRADLRQARNDPRMRGS